MAAGTNPRGYFDCFSCFAPNQINSTTKTAWGRQRGRLRSRKWGKLSNFGKLCSFCPTWLHPRGRGRIWAPQKGTWHLLLLSRETLAALPMPQEEGKFIFRVHLFLVGFGTAGEGRDRKILRALRVPPVTVTPPRLGVQPSPSQPFRALPRNPGQGSSKESPELPVLPGRTLGDIPVPQRSQPSWAAPGGDRAGPGGTAAPQRAQILRNSQGRKKPHP